MRRINYFSLILTCDVTLGHAASGVEVPRTVSRVFSKKIATKKAPPTVGGRRKVQPVTTRKALPTVDEEREVSSETDMEEIFLKKKEEGLTQTDPTGTEYCEFVGKNGKTIIIYRYPDGRVSKVIRAFPEAKFAFSNENLEKYLKEEELLDNIEKSLKEAIKNQDPNVVENLLRIVRDPAVFIKMFPDFLRKTCKILDRNGANRRVRREIINFLVEFGYSFEKN